MQRRHILIIFVLFSFVPLVQAQQDNQFTFFNRNALYYNPGFTGLEGYLNIGAMYRKQWTGFEDAPRVIGLNAHGRLADKKNLDKAPPYSLRTSNPEKYDSLQRDSTARIYSPHGIGGYIYQDKYSPFKDFTAALSYAYHLQVSPDYTWSLGASVGATNSRLDVDKLSVINQMDPVYQDYMAAGDLNQFYVDLTLGSVFYSDKLYVSYSISKFLSQDRFSQDVDNGSELIAHHNLGAGYVFNLSSSIELYPSILLKYVDASPVDADILVKGRFSKKFIAGIGYQRDETLNALVGVNLYDYLSIAYAYGYPFGQLQEVQTGNHSININVALFNTNEAHPRLMW